MKKLFTAIAVIALVCNAAQARTWRINNDPEAKADFLSIDAAMASTEVYAGDVLYLDPGCRLPAQAISKGVTIIGTGYNLTESDEAIVAGITIKANDIKLTGLNVSGTISWERTYNNITIERCKVQGIGFINICYGVKIISCYIKGDVSGGGSTNYNARLPLVLRNSIVLGRICNINNGIISNNVVIYNIGTNYNFPVYNITNSTISNNIIINTTTHTTTTDNVVYYYRNNTIQNVTVEDNNNIVNNILSTDADHAWENYPTNKFIGAKVEDVFVNEGNQEEMYRLKEGSEAIGYGTNGVDCGVFDGMYPYVVHGRPQFVPYIYEAQIPHAPSSDGKLNITLKIKSQNE